MHNLMIIKIFVKLRKNSLNVLSATFDSYTEMATNFKIVEATKEARYEIFLYKCLSPIPFRKYKRRRAYLERAIPRGLRKKIIFYDEVAVGQIEYCPVEVAPYPISCKEKCVIMSCIWVLRKAKGHGFGKMQLASLLLDLKAIGVHGLKSGRWRSLDSSL